MKDESEVEVGGKIEPNVMTAPGRPGAVDKGERQERGWRLALSNATPTASARFVLRLKVAGGKNP